MSHRITTKTSIQDESVAKAALTKAGWSHTVSGKTITVTSGPMNGARINLTTGEVIGDTDYHSDSALQALNQGYSVEQVTASVLSKGGYIVEGPTTVGEDIVLTARVSMA